MTVDARIPIVEYTGNGSVTQFDWDWAMIDDSSINVIVDNERVTGWNLQGNSVVFDTAPASGAAVTLYRRTLVYMPENYLAFGRFHSETTELSVDRAILIAQERAGDRGEGNAPNGIVGGADLSTITGEFDLTVVSERGDDAVLELWNPDDTDPPASGTPDPNIIWAGDDIFGGEYSDALGGTVASFQFQMTLAGFTPHTNDPLVTQGYYPNFNADEYVSWLAIDAVDDAYWMRITETSGQPASRVNIHDGNSWISSGTLFQVRSNIYLPWIGARFNITTFGDTAPFTRIGVFLVEICADAGGLPDENWVSRTVTLEAIMNDSGAPEGNIVDRDGIVVINRDTDFVETR